MYWLEKVLTLSDDYEFLGVLGITMIAPKQPLSAEEVTAQLDKDAVS